MNGDTVPAFLNLGGIRVRQGTRRTKAPFGVGLRIGKQWPQPLFDPRVVFA